MSGDLGKVGLDQGQVFLLIEKLKSQLDVFGEKNSLMLISELKPSNVLSYLDVVSVLDAEL
jgi:hypothetical protein